MNGNTGIITNDLEGTVDKVIEHVGKNIVLAMSIGLAKPILFTNELYKRAKDDPSINLKIITALSPERPQIKGELERRLAGPIIERIFANSPEIDYMLDLRAGKLPKNVEVYEFYSKAGGYLNVPHAQQNHLNSNFTHIVRDAYAKGVNIFAQVIAVKKENGETLYSMGSNADICVGAIDVMNLSRSLGRNVAKIAEVNQNMPFMYGDAIRKADDYDILLHGEQYNYPLFAPPKEAVDSQDYMIGLNVSSIVKDGGTLQIGIGALGDAVVTALNIRHSNNELYNEIIEEAGLPQRYGDLINNFGGSDTFEQGLYGCSEMFIDPFMQLYKRNILRRKVYDNIAIMQLINEGKLSSDRIPEDILKLLNEKKGISTKLCEEDFNMLTRFGILKEGLKFHDGFIYDDRTRYSTDLDDNDCSEKIKVLLGKNLKKGQVILGAFYIGPKSFYDELNSMDEENRSQFGMSGVEKVNQLYGDEVLRSLQRKDGRFVNSGMVATIMGSVASDQLDDGRIISGIGGQYNFVSMAHALPDARSIIMIRSTRGTGKKLSSNIVFNYGHCSIPKHLKDIIVTEYGIADLRGQSDKEAIIEMLNITDSRFQDDLVQQAMKAGKLPPDYNIPVQYQNNFPYKYEAMMNKYKRKGYFQPFPFGTDMLPEEIVLADSLTAIKNLAENNPLKMISKLLMELVKPVPKRALPYLNRMGLDKPSNLKERILSKTVLVALRNMSNL